MVLCNDSHLAQTINHCSSDKDFSNKLYIPGWYTKMITSDIDPQCINKAIIKQYCITGELSEEIRSYYPTRDEIYMNQTSGDCERDLEASKMKCATMFPIRHVFLNKTQLDQAFFSNDCNCKKVHYRK